MGAIKNNQIIGKYTIQSLIKENAYTETYRVEKLFVPDFDVWALFEVILDHSPEVGSIIERGLGILQHARQAFYEALQ